MQPNDSIRILTKFLHIDKYQSFHGILPSVLKTPEAHRQIVTDILNTCCKELLRQLEQPTRPEKKLMRQSLIECMDELAIARIDAENREFGYQLGWYIAEKIRLDLRKGTERKLWGYWAIEANEVRIPLRPRIAPRVKAKQEQPKKRKKADA